ncbi:MAG TPA: hypothetical protein VK821_06885 [Dehalococcoidia bacterium]|nr:hypothetical protein [Dehalococcoidia bacterium]
MIDESELEQAALPAGRPWFMLALLLAVALCGAAVPASAVLRGVVRLGAVRVAPNQEWRAPLLVLGGPAVVDGVTDAPVVVIGGDLRIAGRAGDDLIAMPGAITIGPSAIAAGNAISLGGEVSIAPSGAVLGSVIGSRMPWSASTTRAHQTSVMFLVERLRLAGLAVSALLLLGLGVWALLPWPALVTTATARRCRVRSVLLGVGTLLWAPLIVAPLAVSLAGLPLALLLLLSLIGLWLVGVVSTAVRLGHRLLSFGHRPHSMLTATLAGLVCLGLLPALPFVGSLALLLAGCIGLGAALVALWDREASGELSVTQTLAAMKFPE